MVALADLVDDPTTAAWVYGVFIVLLLVVALVKKYAPRNPDGSHTSAFRWLDDDGDGD